jgi:hypothetical protein
MRQPSPNASHHCLQIQPNQKLTNLNDRKYQMETTSKVPNRRSRMKASALATVAGAALAFSSAIAQSINSTSTEMTFHPLRSPASKGSALTPYARDTVKIRSISAFAIMTVSVSVLPPNTAFDLFLIQVPNLPFGLSSYQGEPEITL